MLIGKTLKYIIDQVMQKKKKDFDENVDNFNPYVCNVILQVTKKSILKEGKHKKKIVPQTKECEKAIKS